MKYNHVSNRHCHIPTYTKGTGVCGFGMHFTSISGVLIPGIVTDAGIVLQVLTLPK